MKFIYEVITEDGRFTYDSVEGLQKDFSIQGWTSEGGSTREELWLQPKLWDALGPMYNGLKDGVPVILYESQVMYDRYSQ
jgi:hypothetical protein